MYSVHMRVQCSDTHPELLVDDVEPTELTIESILGNALLEVFDSVLVENITISYSPEHFDEDKKNNPQVTVNTSLDILLQIDKMLDDNVEHTELAIEDVVDTALLEVFDSVLVENITVSYSPEHLDIHLQINEEPLTAQNFTSIMSAFTEIHTKCWLIAHGRFAELIEYTQTHNERFAKEANLVIVKITHSSPADIKLNVNVDATIQGLAEAIRKIIDAIMQAPHRRKAAELANQATEVDIKQKTLEAQVKQAEKEQNLQIAAQQADLNRQKALIEIRQQQIQGAKQQIELENELLELKKNRLQFVRKEAGETVDMLRPGIDERTRAMLIETLIPDLLQIANGQGLIITLPEPKKEETK